MRIIFVSGVSGAGKTVFIKALEDLGFYCVDNLPVPLLVEFIDLLRTKSKYKEIGIVVDIREKEFLDGFDNIVNEIKKFSSDISLQFVFLDARDEILLRRYSETRRKHPIDIFDILKGLNEERYLLKPIKQISDFIIDTSDLTPHMLRKKAEEIVLGKLNKSRLNVKIISFGYKYGIPRDVDIIFDMRFIDNPYYVAEMKDKTGLDDEVKKFLESKQETLIFLEKLYDIITFMFENFIKQEKSFVTVGFGCTGGKHRSVFFAENLYNFLKDKYHDILVVHRDINH
jgi:UPF0042 nucleotide-binding protein